MIVAAVEGVTVAAVRAAIEAGETVAAAAAVGLTAAAVRVVAKRRFGDEMGLAAIEGRERLRLGPRGAEQITRRAAGMWAAGARAGLVAATVEGLTVAAVRAATELAMGTVKVPTAAAYEVVGTRRRFATGAVGAVLGGTIEGRRWRREATSLEASWGVARMRAART